MGQLADDVADALRDARRTGYHRGLAEAHQDLVDRIEQLESQVDYKAPVDIEVLSDRADVADRLADAEQRAAAAWAAVTEVTKRGARVSGAFRLANGTPRDSNLSPNNGVQYRCQFDHLDMVVDVYSRRSTCTIMILEDDYDMPNPDLLERASVELAEAYQRAKAEEQRQADGKAVAT